MASAQNTPAVDQLAALLVLVAGTFVVISCGGLRTVAESTGLVPLDSARAVAVAKHNVCGDVSSGDPTCVLRSYQRSGGRFEILLDRRPPAGNDRVLVTVRGNGSQIDVTQVDTASGRPR